MEGLLSHNKREQPFHEKNRYYVQKEEEHVPLGNRPTEPAPQLRNGCFVLFFWVGGGVWGIRCCYIFVCMCVYIHTTNAVPPRNARTHTCQHRYQSIYLSTTPHAPTQIPIYLSTHLCLSVKGMEARSPRACCAFLVVLALVFFWVVGGGGKKRTRCWRVGVGVFFLGGGQPTKQPSHQTTTQRPHHSHARR